ncbi:nucleotide sugar dehydrogenase [Candidatus Albibeggiatoa sp. nov. NOAA]|uniref:nucleotide sugar dehydrogenase n=1 Tax=Candidatus Albibeggiatoa sp. nov. NOAA TaxID=3162724 RepID=UPI0032FB9B32|nr:nucleotide sugar dehydrogenase [Thiotrichaceae bacterium]
MTHQRKISVIGLGYVGLPVAMAFAKQNKVIGFDVNAQRIAELNEQHDATQELTTADWENTQICFTTDPEKLAQADFHIIAVPTPVDDTKTPDLLPVLKASKTVGKHLKKGDIVVYESTVYPGATEEVCIPVLERTSGLQCGQDFKVGYSPERINPGDTQHRFENIIKVVSGLDDDALDIIAQVYGSVVQAGVHRASSIKVAEASKVIENIQRDVNIALINELAMIFNRLQIDTHDVLQAAGTKWNFLPFTPGLVGGHCIGVDPYYLKHKAEQVGYTPHVIPASRQVNDGMGAFIGQQVVEHLTRIGCLLQETTVTILGLAFKENVADLRNTRVVDIVNVLQQHGMTIQIHDPWVEPQQVQQEYGLTLCPEPQLQKAQCVILAVAHQDYVQKGWPWLQQLLDEKRCLVMDIKGGLPQDNIPENIVLWRL